jgi:hypothetical protein
MDIYVVGTLQLLRKECEMVANWLRKECEKNAKWLRNECETNAKWLRNECETNAKRMRNGCETNATMKCIANTLRTRWNYNGRIVKHIKKAREWAKIAYHNEKQQLMNAIDT